MNVMTTDNTTHRTVLAAINPIVGGGGGMPTRDGTNGSGADGAYLKNTPVEITETEVPIRILRYGLMADSGGAGRWRGGLATALDFTVFAPNSRVTARNRDRCRFRPWGTLGGKAGAPSDFVLNPGTNRERVLGNVDLVTMEPQDVLHIHSPGGGGRGDPLDREPWKVRDDVRRLYVSEAAARRDYGVIVRDGALDEAATEALRAEMRGARPASGQHFQFGPEREAHERIWTNEAYAAMTEIMASLPTHWRFFVKTRLFAMLDVPSADGAGAVRDAFAALRESYPELAA
jgi:N-methylhydantoinase B